MTERVLNERFEVLEEIGRGAQAVTFRARDRVTGDIVCVKELDFRRLEDWKAQELFEREGKTLASLDHPAIPRYVDAFTEESDDEISLFLVQEFVEGRTLADELEDGRRWTEEELVRDAEQLLEALAYLHGRSPPVIHRDVKPSNVIRRRDGKLALVDFGAVQNVLPASTGGSTVIGTPGYMAMEQLMGRAVPATDVYAVGATLIHLVTGIDPASLPASRNRIDWKGRARVSERLAGFIDRATEPSAEDRYEDAGDALRALRSLQRRDGRRPKRDTPTALVHPSLVGLPPNTAVVKTHNGRVLSFPLSHGRRRFAMTVTEGPQNVVIQARRVDRHPDAQTAGPITLGLALLLFAPPFGVLFIMMVVLAQFMRRFGNTPDLTISIDRDEVAVDRRQRRAAQSDTRRARWTVDRRGGLRLDDGRRPLLHADSPAVNAWLVNYLSATTAALAGEDPARVVLGLDEDSSDVEFANNEPAYARRRDEWWR